MSNQTINPNEIKESARQIINQIHNLIELKSDTVARNLSEEEFDLIKEQIKRALLEEIIQNI